MQAVVLWNVACVDRCVNDSGVPGCQNLQWDMLELPAMHRDTPHQRTVQYNCRGSLRYHRDVRLGAFALLEA